MTTFELSGEQIGTRHIRAMERAAISGKVRVNCKGATFVDAFNLVDVTFAFADFTGARFTRGARLENVVFESDVSFDRAHSSDFSLRDACFRANAEFRELRAANLTVRDTQFMRYASFDGVRLGFGTFRDVQFGAEARFRGAQSRGPLTLRSARFDKAASFQEGIVGQLSLPGCDFRGPFQTQEMKVEGVASFVGARFADTRRLEFSAGSEVTMRDTSFSQPVALSVDCPALDATGACFERGADISLSPGGHGRFAGASFLGPSVILTRASAQAPAKIDSLDGTRIDHLTLEALDLSQCSFARLHRADGILISGRGQLDRAPVVVQGAYRREVLADEVLRRDGGGRPMLMWAPAEWKRPSALAERDASRAQEIADLYRAMRKAREDAHDYPGAADFYYGEMEMRREGADNWVERAVLTLYWLISGYGMRATRAAAAFVILILLLSVGFQLFGVVDPPGFPRTVAWTLVMSISLLHPSEHMDLTVAGIYMSVLARICGPALIALVVLALRSLVRR